MMKKHISKLILEIQELVLNISNNTDHDMFFSYSGHVQKIEVGYCKHGWTQNKKIIKVLDVFLDLSEDLDKELIKAKEFLSRLGENDESI